MDIWTILILPFSVYALWSSLQYPGNSQIFFNAFILSTPLQGTITAGL